MDMAQQGFYNLMQQLRRLVSMRCSLYTEYGRRLTNSYKWRKVSAT